jgi:hypothetical protein
MTEVLSEFNSVIKASLKKFSLPDWENFSEFKRQLLSLKLDSDD